MADYFTKSKLQGKFHPQFVSSSALDIDFSYLYRIGIRAVAFDADGTIVRNRAVDIDTTNAKKLRTKIHKAGIDKIFIATNASRDLHLVAKKLGAGIYTPVQKKGKPSKAYYDGLLHAMKSSAHQAAMIGDRTLQDIYGANRTGIVSIQVELSPEFATIRDKIVGRHLWHPRLVRAKRNKHTANESV